MSYIVPREKPKKCMNCPFIDKITYDCKLMYGNDYPDFYIQYENCPLIEIPNPHGRLIDADKLLEKAYWDYNEAIDDYNNFKVVSEYDIADTPTVIKENK